MRLPILYHKTKKEKIQVCEIWTEGDKIYTKFGQQDGKMQTAEQVALPKNVGKKNATTGSAQAEKEARAKWQKKKDKKYVEDLDAVNEVRISPMKAHPYELKKATWPSLAQPKLDGLRCMSYLDDDGNVILHSNGNKIYTNVQHINKQLKLILQPGEILDGELYIHGATLQQMNRLVRKYRPGETEDVEYWVYDSTTKEGNDNTSFEFRNSRRIGILSRIDPAKRPNIKNVRTVSVINENNLKSFHKSLVSDGYEGTILRSQEGKYTFGYRSYDLLKYKDFQDAEFEVIGFKEGTGKFRGTPIWRCRNDINDEEFEVTPKGTLDSRREMFKDAESYIGKMLTVRFIDRTEKNIPKYGSGKTFRIEEDLDERS